MSCQNLDPSRQSLLNIYQQDVEATKRRRTEARDAALAEWRESLRTNDPDLMACFSAARGFLKLREHDGAITVLKEGIRSCVPSLFLYRWYVGVLEECNLTADAISVAQEAARLFPDNLSVKLLEALIFPTIYHTADELDYYRHRYVEGLQRVREAVRLDHPEGRQQALSVTQGRTTSLIAYQGRNERKLQEARGHLLHRIMAANFPEWVQHLPMPAAPSGSKLRVGYASSRFRNYSAMKYFLGWLREHNSAKFDIHAYYIGRKREPITEELAGICHSFRHIPNSLEEACRAIMDDHLHVLVFLDWGVTEPIMSQLVALRLAPVQCMAWDQPFTSGLPTVDYFLSSALAEPENGQDHYSEKLVLLPGVGVYYPKPVIPTPLLRKTRRDFQLREDAVVYLCCQVANKFLTEQDALFARIASQVPNSQFVFLVKSTFVEADLRKRLDLAFSACGLQAGDHCMVLIEVDIFSYWNLQLLGDVYLDSLGWSGGVTTFEAVACRLPIVTLPGLQMRSRQSYAILAQLGVTETIARDESDYVEIAVRLGLERSWREGIVQRMVSGYPSLYSDKSSVWALEEFFTRTVNERLRTEP